MEGQFLQMLEKVMLDEVEIDLEWLVFEDDSSVLYKRFLWDKLWGSQISSVDWQLIDLYWAFSVKCPSTNNKVNLNYLHDFVHTSCNVRRFHNVGTAWTTLPRTESIEHFYDIVEIGYFQDNNLDRIIRKKNCDFVFVSNRV